MDIISRLRTDLAGVPKRQVEELAVKVGVPAGTFRKIVNGQTPNPRYRTVQKIEAYYASLSPVREAA
jgi:transcriptional regulator with XRE-family HTH domain